MESTFLAITSHPQDVLWLQESLSNLGQVLQAEHQTLDDILRLIDVTQASLLFISLDRDNINRQSTLIEDCIEAKPLLAVVALGDGLDNQLVLSAMRAGAKDFIAYGARPSEVAGLVRRIYKRLPTVAPTLDRAHMVSLYCCQGDSNGAFIASHLALSLQQATKPVLLLDLGQPEGEALDDLGLTANFHFGDALRNMRRFDTSLIESAFVRHPTGLRLLALQTGDQLSAVSASELYLLLGALRQYFSYVVVNLAGTRDCDALRVLISQSDQLIWLTDQSVANCQRNLVQLNLWRNAELINDNCQLLIDRYFKTVAPDANALGQSYNLPVLSQLPYQPELRLQAKNIGKSLFELAPREPLTRQLKQLATHTATTPSAAVKNLHNLWGLLP